MRQQFSSIIPARTSVKYREYRKRIDVENPRPIFLF